MNGWYLGWLEPVKSWARHGVGQLVFYLFYYSEYLHALRLD
jgi:hypothetical protein